MTHTLLSPIYIFAFIAIFFRLFESSRCKINARFDKTLNVTSLKHEFMETAWKMEQKDGETRR